MIIDYSSVNSLVWFQFNYSESQLHEEEFENIFKDFSVQTIFMDFLQCSVTRQDFSLHFNILKVQLEAFVFFLTLFYSQDSPDKRYSNTFSSICNTQVLNVSA